VGALHLDTTAIQVSVDAALHRRPLAAHRQRRILITVKIARLMRRIIDFCAGWEPKKELAWIIHEGVATVVPARDRRVVFGGVGDAVIEV
jgi:hypothetical protein